MTVAYRDALIELGRISSHDFTKYDKATTDSMLSHWRLLKANGIKVKHLLYKHPTEITRIIDNLKSKSKNELSAKYKSQIGNTINKLSPELKYAYKPKQSELDKFHRLESVEYMKAIKTLLTEMARKCLTVTENPTLDNSLFVEYMVSLTGLLITTTSLRISEVLALKYSHIVNMMLGKPIYIETKKNVTKPRTVVPNNSLNRVLDVVRANKFKVANLLVGKSAADRNRKEIQEELKRLNEDYIIIPSASYLTKCLRSFAVVNSIDLPRHGFTIFRKFTTTVLTEKGQHYIAKVFQNHKKVDTTLNNYALLAQDATDKAYIPFFDPQTSVLRIKDTPASGKLEYKLENKNQEQRRPLPVPQKSKLISTKLENIE